MNVDQNLLFKDILNVRSEHELLSFMESEEPYKFQALPKAFIKNHLNHWASTSNFYRFEHREQEECENYPYEIYFKQLDPVTYLVAQIDKNNVGYFASETDGLIWKYVRNFKFEMLAKKDRVYKSLMTLEDLEFESEIDDFFYWTIMDFLNRNEFDNPKFNTFGNTFPIVLSLSQRRCVPIVAKYSSNNHFRAVLSNDDVLIISKETFNLLKVGTSVSFDPFLNSYDFIYNGQDFHLPILSDEDSYQSSFDALFHLQLQGIEIESIFQIVYTLFKLQTSGPNKSIIGLLTDLYRYLEYIYEKGDFWVVKSRIDFTSNYRLPKRTDKEDPV